LFIVQSDALVDPLFSNAKRRSEPEARSSGPGAAAGATEGPGAAADEQKETPSWRRTGEPRCETNGSGRVSDSIWHSPQSSIALCRPSVGRHRFPRSASWAPIAITPIPHRQRTKVTAPRPL
jgi:hypothetical protein